MTQLPPVPVEDIPLFTGAATELHLLAAIPLAPGFPRIDAALRLLSEYIAGRIRRRRDEPRDDIVTSLITV